MPAVDPRHSLRLLGPEIEALNSDIRALTNEQWTRASNCAGWQVADLVSHVVRNGWSFLVFTNNALTGAEDPAFGPAVAQVQEEIKAAGPRAAADRQQRETKQFLDLITGLSESDMQKLGRHPQGPRPVAWACSQRLAEVAFHHWDLGRSLGAQEPLETALARHLLSFMLDPQGSSIMLAPLPEGTPTQTFRLNATEDGSSWCVTVGSQGRVVDPAPASEAAIAVRAPAGWLALALYGRVSVDGPEFSVDGPPDAAQQFKTAFGG